MLCVGLSVCVCALAADQVRSQMSDIKCTAAFISYLVCICRSRAANMTHTKTISSTYEVGFGQLLVIIHLIFFSSGSAGNNTSLTGHCGILIEAAS